MVSAWFVLSVDEQMKTAAEHLQALLDGRDKAVSGTSYRELFDLINKIKVCPFFTEVRPATIQTGNSYLVRHFISLSLICASVHVYLDSLFRGTKVN